MKTKSYTPLSEERVVAEVQCMRLVNVYIDHVSTYLPASTHVITNECAPIVCLSLYVVPSQCAVQSLNKYSVL